MHELAVPRAIIVTDLINIHEVSRLMRTPENGKRPVCSLRGACSALSPGRSPAIVSAGENKLQIGFKPDLLTHGDAHFLGQVVAHALKVPARIPGLNVPSGVGGTAREYVLAGSGVPLDAPSAPGEQAGRFSKRRIEPAVVDAELNA